MTDRNDRLRRELGVAGAVLLGLGSIVGTGVYVSLGLAVETAGDQVVWAVAIAAVVALCNGLSSAQLAAAHPVSGGTYEYGYRFLHPAAGFTAGWLFLIAKSASAGTAALGIAAYLGLGTSRLAGFVAVVAVTGLVLAGIRRSNQANAAIVFVSVGALVALVIAAWPSAAAASPITVDDPDLFGAAALVFVAFTGYGRIATLGEEVHDPSRSIPIAVVVTLAATAVLYASVAFVESRVVPADVVTEGSPLVPIADSVAGGTLAAVVRLGALAALIGVLLNLVLGLSRVALAMGRRNDLPISFARIDRGGRTPTVAIVAVATIIAAFSLVGDIRTTWSFSALTVLVYYALTNISALALPSELRRYPVVVPILGLVGCLGLAVFIQPEMWLWGGALVAAGLVWHLLRRRTGRGSSVAT